MIVFFVQILATNAHFANMQYIHDFFMQYGEVESTNIRSEKDVVLDGLIQFADSKIADNLIERGLISIFDIEYEVKSMNEPKDDVQETNVSIVECLENLKLNEVKSEPSVQDTQSNILTVLNDDCLRLVFRKFNDLCDFHSIANVCKHFNRIAKEVFHHKIKHTFVDFIDIMPTRDEVTFDQIEIFLKKFGRSVFHAFVFQPLDANVILKLVGKNCKNICYLLIKDLNITEETLHDVRPMFLQLKCLQIFITPESDYGLLNCCLIHCTQLESLKIGGSHHTQCTLPAINRKIGN